MFKDRLKEARQRANLTQAQLADAIGIAKTTVTGYERGNSEPDIKKIEQIMSVLKVDANFLFQDEMVKHGGFTKKLSYTEERFIERFRVLDSYGRQAIEAVMNVEYDRCANIEKSRLEMRQISMLVYNDPAAAGVPLYAESDFDRINFPEDEVPPQADFGVRISGDSMEPTIHDKQIVWVKRQETIINNRVGIFMLDGGTAVCKRAEMAENGHVARLISDNPLRSNIEGSELEGLRVVGEVIL